MRAIIPLIDLPHLETPRRESETVDLRWRRAAMLAGRAFGRTRAWPVAARQLCREPQFPGFRPSHRGPIALTRAAIAIASAHRPTDDTLTFRLETVEPVFSKALEVLVGLQSLGAGCDNNRWPLSLPSPSPPRSATLATPCLSTRFVKRLSNPLCTPIQSVKEGIPSAFLSLNPALSLCMWLACHIRTMIRTLRNANVAILQARGAVSGSCKYMALVYDMLVDLRLLGGDIRHAPLRQT